MKLLSKFLTLTTSALLAAGFLVVAPTAIPMSATAETIISQLGIDIDGEAATLESGQSVSLSSDGTRVAIGDAYNDGNGRNAGQVRVYELSGGTWSQLGSDIDGEAVDDYSGDSVSVSSDGTRVAIGAYGNDGNGMNAGHVRVYELSGGTWSQLGSDIDGEAVDDYSGMSVSLSSDGTRVAIGAHSNDGNGNASGHVRVYELSGGTWSQLGSDIDGEAASDFSGQSVSLSSDGTRVAIGAIGNDGTGASDAGHVRVYDLTVGAWVQAGSDIDGEAADDYSGGSVSISSDGTRVAIGANENDGNGINAGHVRIYELISGTWTQLGSDIDGEAASDFSGQSVSLSNDGTRAAIGANANDGNGSNAGHVRIYELSGGDWSQLGSDIDGEAASDFSGQSVSLSSDGTRVAIGAPFNVGNGVNSGHVRLYSIVFQAPAPAPYTGPLPTNYSDRTPSIGDEVIISGLRLNLVTSLTIDGVTAVISNKSLDSLTIVIPIGITAGLKDLVMTGPAGKLTAQGALTVQESIPAIINEALVSSKLNAGSFNGYVAVYAKGHKGKTLSWKIAGKWFKTTVTSDYQVFQRRTAAVGLDFDVHLYINGEKQLTKTVTTR